ncbi:hypothetical protein [uncultured Thioclava sp.]|uniref:hypothetical protein n=1 Tax=uncultured Thioclava sp. TaxID=473858 RepID=UPI0025E0D8EA|nr:hypothetical protein [uncultured Thioclava sp.]
MLDRQTEIIAHFIGAFQLTTEQVSARHHYDTFRALQLAQKEPGALLNVNVHVTSDYLLQDFTPGLRLAVPPPLAPTVPMLPHADHVRLPQPGQPVYPGDSYEPQSVMSFQSSISQSFFVTLAPPSSVATLTVQINNLSDTDSVMSQPFTLPEQFAGAFSSEAIAAKMADLVETAKTLGAPDTSVQWLSVQDQASVLRDRLDTLDPEDAPAGAEVAMFHHRPWVPEAAQETGAGGGDAGSDAQEAPAPSVFGGAPVLNGQIVSDAPTTLSDRLEARNPAPSPTETPQGQVLVEDGAAGTVISPTLSGGAISADQSLSTGNNLALNEIHIQHNWIDAPVIAVAGMAQSLSLISQINVLRDFDSFNGDAGAPNMGGGIGSQIVNLATQNTLANPAQDLAPAVTGGAKLLGMVRIDGDLMIDNTTYQINHINDSDVVSYEFGTHHIEISTGGNTVSNLELLLQLGGHFDAIFVGGDMVQLASIEQINVLLDDDLFLSNGSGTALYSGHDNLLWNEASITHLGTDTALEMSSSFQSTLDALGAMAGTGDSAASSGSGAQSTPDAAAYAAVSGLFGDPLLGDLDAMRVLWIEGDLLIRDSLTQINLLSDSDVISVALPGDDALADISAGDNILANVASLTVAGVDSTIMAGAGSYSDAVLYQAGMFASDQGPFDLAGTFSAPQGDLASEAVVFLSDDFNDGPGSGFVEGAGFIPDTMNSGSLDALHSVLA